MPEVLANKQSGYDSSKEGLGFENIDKIQLEPIGGTEGHIDRRAQELEIDFHDDNIWGLHKA